MGRAQCHSFLGITKGSFLLALLNHILVAPLPKERENVQAYMERIEVDSDIVRTSGLFTDLEPITHQLHKAISSFWSMCTRQGLVQSQRAIQMWPKGCEIIILAGPSITPHQNNAFARLGAGTPFLPERIPWRLIVACKWQGHTVYLPVTATPECMLSHDQSRARQQVLLELNNFYHCREE